MRGSLRTTKIHEHIQAIIDQTSEPNPREAVRIKARELLRNFSPYFPEPPPYDMNELASCVGLHLSEEDPAFSSDSEIAPEIDGRVVLRVNKSRPLTRQRFSIAHEIGHTLFPNYQMAVRCRKANERRWTDDDFLETLCDVAASEFMFPLPWFEDSVESMPWTGEGVAQLADKYLASPEATVRRIVELHSEPMAAVFFSWKLKPKEEKQIRKSARQPSLFAEFVPEQPAMMLRVDYPILNDQFRSSVLGHIPEHKSIPSEGPIFQASISQSPCEGVSILSFGRFETEFNVIALPVYTDEEHSGPGNASSVVAILRPLS